MKIIQINSEIFNQTGNVMKTNKNDYPLTDFY